MSKKSSHGAMDTAEVPPEDDLDIKLNHIIIFFDGELNNLDTFFVVEKKTKEKDR